MPTENRCCFVNVNGYALDGENARFSALAIKDGRIATVGGPEAVAPLIASGWPVRDIGGRTMLPGFIDTHQHLGLTAQVLGGLDLSVAKNLGDVRAILAEGYAAGDPGHWVLGCRLNELELAERRLPLRGDLDAACPDRPAMLVHASWHLCVLNSKALELLELPPFLPGMDLDGGAPTGVIRDPGTLTHVFPKASRLTPDEVKLERFRAACLAAIRQGITTLHCLEGGDFGPGDTPLAAKNRQTLPLNAIIWNQVMDIPETLALGLPRIGGCICADGAMSARTAALLEPYSDDPNNRGALNYTQEQMDEFVLAAHKAGLQVAVHCETDGAIEQVLSAMEKAIAAAPRADHRHRIEHCEIPTLDQLDRMARAGVIAAMQPSFFPFLVDWDDYVSRFGEDRMARIHPYRTMANKGVRMCGGSDCPITPYTPLTGIQAAVLHPIASERLTPEEAVRLFTSDAAFAGFEEDERGTIEPGKAADLVVLMGDPFTAAPDAIARIAVAETYCAGVRHAFED
ncbi:amidohydrolase [Pseudodesulfovibrio sp.]|uniref:amidohydrolase n=1 Tax=Pseudodesulfovibrio sp. TaxID=2035812 RepID=UPI002602CB99|nr:amidohydrolase [Pseudodesulfovibrio sp.]MDD3313802.1 amidohydrolase [Pseudodesulfovibrio sp.]